MRDGYDMSIHINTSQAEVLVEQRKKGGVIARKNISPQSLSQCFLTSRVDDERHATGLLPEGCIAAVMEKRYVYYFIRYPDLYADFTYFDTEYLRFPIPRLVFGFKFMPQEGKVAGCRLCVVEDAQLDGGHASLPLSFFQCGRQWEDLYRQQRPAGLPESVQAAHAGRIYSADAQQQRLLRQDE